MSSMPRVEIPTFIVELEDAFNPAMISNDKVASHACVVGDLASIIGRARNTGTFQGDLIEADEYMTDIYRRVNGEWRCMLTHLTPARGQAASTTAT